MDLVQTLGTGDLGGAGLSPTVQCGDQVPSAGKLLSTRRPHQSQESVSVSPGDLPLVSPLSVGLLTLGAQKG